MSHLGPRLSALVDGELDDAERDQAHSHLVDCEQCRAEAATLRALKRRVRELGEATADSTLTRRLMELEGLAPASSLAASRGRLPSRYLVAGAVAAALAVGLGAASFAAGGAQQHAPGPTITPEVDSFNLQQAATFGQSPSLPSPTGALSRQAVSRQALSPQAVSRQAVSRQAVSPQAVPPQAVSRQAVLRQALLRQALTRQVVGSLKP